MKPKYKIALTEENLECVIDILLAAADDTLSYYRNTFLKVILLYLAGLYGYISVRVIYSELFFSFIATETLLLTLFLCIFDIIFLFLTLLFLIAVFIFCREYWIVSAQKRNMLCTLKNIKTNHLK